MLCWVDSGSTIDLVKVVLDSHDNKLMVIKDHKTRGQCWVKDPLIFLETSC